MPNWLCHALEEVDLSPFSQCMLVLADSSVRSPLKSCPMHALSLQ